MGGSLGKHTGKQQPLSKQFIESLLKLYFYFGIPMLLLLILLKFL